MSIDGVGTREMKSLSAEIDPPAKNTCPTCHGNGLVGLDDTIIECPTCKGKKVIEVKNDSK